ncbi:MAG TPA: aspartate aminotransferase family protein [Chitinivibrionales bacterium]|nr:aspartate aminotransferase family protein [Chitinivibrionales bacterium]
MEHTDYNDVFVPTFSRSGSPFVRGQGMYLYDADGRQYLDFGSGIAVNALGHSHPAIVAALKEQGSLLIHTSNLYFTQTQYELAKLLSAKTFGGKVFLCNSGTEAIEAAIKFSRKWASAISKDKFHILSFYKGFHGRTYGALSATAQEHFHEGFGPLLEGFHYATLNDIPGTKAALDKNDFAAIIVEPLQGEGGVNPAAKEFLQFLRDYADQKKIALVFDEIQCGMGRTGTLWCCEQYGIVPDILAAAKPLGGGLPLGAAVCREHIAAAISPGNHGTTFGGNPLACALGCVTLSIITQPVFLSNVKKNGELLKKGLAGIAEKHPSIKEIRGMGLLVGAEMESDPKELVPQCREKGLLVIKAEHNTMRFMPPLIVEEKDISTALSIFERVLVECKL